jgi:hypothetical protein
MLAGTGAGDDVLGMHPAGGEDRDDVNVLSHQESTDIVTGGDTELRCHRIGARADRIADRDKTGPADVIAARNSEWRLAIRPHPSRPNLITQIPPKAAPGFIHDREPDPLPREFYIN